MEQPRAPRKELILSTCGGTIQGSVFVDDASTFHDVRQLVEEEFDDDMLPSPPIANIINKHGGSNSSGSSFWAFFVDGIRMSAKQEQRRLAWDFLDKSICIEAKETVKARRSLPLEVPKPQQPPPLQDRKPEVRNDNSDDNHDVENTGNIDTASGFHLPARKRRNEAVDTSCAGTNDDYHDMESPNGNRKRPKLQHHCASAKEPQELEPGGLMLIPADTATTTNETPPLSMVAVVTAGENLANPITPVILDTKLQESSDDNGSIELPLTNQEKKNMSIANIETATIKTNDNNNNNNFSSLEMQARLHEEKDMEDPNITSVIVESREEEELTNQEEKNAEMNDTIKFTQLDEKNDQDDVKSHSEVVDNINNTSSLQMNEAHVSAAVSLAPTPTSALAIAAKNRTELKENNNNDDNGVDTTMIDTGAGDDQTENKNNSNSTSLETSERAYEESEMEDSDATVDLLDSKEEEELDNQEEKKQETDDAKKSTQLHENPSMTTNALKRKSDRSADQNDNDYSNDIMATTVDVVTEDNHKNKNEEERANESKLKDTAPSTIVVAKQNGKENKEVNNANGDNHDSEAATIYFSAEECHTNGDEGANHDNSVLGDKEVVVEEEGNRNNPHREADEAMGKSQHVLQKMATMLQENQLFCTDARRNEWLEEIKNLNESNKPCTMIGVLGNTGVGKSSLLNALLDEASVLPTSGSRGCTAAVVELLFHSDLLRGKNKDPSPSDVASSSNSPLHPQRTVPLYQGTVQFMQLDDWRKELKVLVDECSTAQKTVYAVAPMDQRMPDAAAAWQKINQVYGRGTMDNFKGVSSVNAYTRLANNDRVVRLLTSPPGETYNSITVSEGEVLSGSEMAMELLQPFEKMKGKSRRYKKKCAKSFRTKINSYVYRKGNGEEAQTWPLIQKVTLKGPWTVLSTGACLVDLPGVRDANAARAKVSENYLQNCHHIAIVAPIKRAVDDGTAKELLGEQFKRRLLMDGQYGNVFFICTQTDDIEATETMHDHTDVADQVEGRMEQMTDLLTQIGSMEKKINEKIQMEEDLKEDFKEAKQAASEAQAELKDATADNNMDNDSDIDVENLQELQTAVTAANLAMTAADEKLQRFKEDMKSLEVDKKECSDLQRQLKTICARVRNEYSTKCLQEDFKAGLEQLYNDGDGESDNTNLQQQTALPEDFNMDVFCISSNDYLKLLRIKPSSDGPPNTFSSSHDTQIPQLRKYIHQTTARYRKSFAKTFVENSNDLLDRMKLFASGTNAPIGRSAYRSKSLFETEIKKVEQKMNPIAADFRRQLDLEVKGRLIPSLKVGALKGRSAAISTVDSWGSKNRRSRHEKVPGRNGLYWSTYQATVRRDGVYDSMSAGAIDMNQELCDPMEREFSTDWQRVMDSTICQLLSEIEMNSLQICLSANQALAKGLRQNGLDNSRVSNMLNTSVRSCSTTVKTQFQMMKQLAVQLQRELSRCLLPSVQEKMKRSYMACVSVQGGPGVYNRMKGAMHDSSQSVVTSMFDEAAGKILKGISDLIERIQNMIIAIARVMSKTMESVFSICWEERSERLVDPAMQAKIRECIDAMLPEINKLIEIQKEACKILGIELEEVELDVMGVESLEKSLERRMNDAEASGNIFDLCNDDCNNSALEVNPQAARVKSEPIGFQQMNASQSPAAVPSSTTTNTTSNTRSSVHGGTPSSCSLPPSAAAWLDRHFNSSKWRQAEVTRKFSHSKKSIAFSSPTISCNVRPHQRQAAALTPTTSAHTPPGGHTPLMAIDLCDSDDDWIPSPPSGLRGSNLPLKVKTDPDEIKKQVWDFINGESDTYEENTVR